MPIISPAFLLFVGVLFVLYYLTPGRLQWALLLLGSCVFYLYGGVAQAGYILFTTVSIFLGGRAIGAMGTTHADWLAAHKDAPRDERKAASAQADKRKRRVLVGVVVLNLSILAFLKYYNFFANTTNGLLGSASLPVLELALPIGISFYTFQSIGYIIDVYRGVAQPQGNIFKFALFTTFFPTVMQGPISRYGELGEQLYAGRRFDYRMAKDGIIRVAWGLFKKAVIADKLAGMVAVVYGDAANAGGAFVVLATVLFAFQLYTDFSGYMDMMIGVAQMFGITLAENFRTPFFSRTISEYWLRWHITLGAWLRDYLFYPLLKSRPIQGLSKRLKPLGKKRAKAITTYLAMFILWFTIGLWHGADWTFVIGSGLLHWLYIVSGEVAAPLSARVKNALRITDDTKWFRLFQQLRTFALVCLGFVFFRADSVATAFTLLGKLLHPFSGNGAAYAAFLAAGYSRRFLALALAFMVIVFVVSLLQNKYKVRDLIARQPAVVRWALYFALVFLIMCFGEWETGMDAQFIYYQF